MVYRIYVEKKPALANEAAGIYSDLSLLLGIKGLKGVRLLNRYDVENVSEELFRAITGTVLSEPQLDIVTESIPEGDFAAVLTTRVKLSGVSRAMGASISPHCGDGIPKHHARYSLRNVPSCICCCRCACAKGILAKRTIPVVSASSLCTGCAGLPR